MSQELLESRARAALNTEPDRVLLQEVPPKRDVVPETRPVRAGEFLMWYRYGDFRYENGYPAQIVKVLPDLVTVDLLVHSLNGTEFPKCVKHHTSGVEPSVLRTNGHYATIEEHHQLLLADVSRQAANRKAQMEQAQKRQELEANQNAARAMLRKGRKPTEVANLLSLDLSWCQEVWEAFQGAGS